MTETRPPILIVREPIDRDTLEQYVRAWFGDMVKVVVDIEREILTLGGELHADGEFLLLDDGSLQDNVWGANIHPFRTKGRILHTAVMNIRGARNASVEVESASAREAMTRIIRTLLPVENEN